MVLNCQCLFAKVRIANQKNRFLLTLFCAVFVSLVSVDAGDAQSIDEIANQWHHWRGPNVTGVSATAQPPLEWSESKNIQWKVPVDGEGGSTPIVWGDKVFLLTAIKTDKLDASIPNPEDQPKRNFFDIKTPNAVHQFVVICLDRHSGKELWRQVADERIPHEGHHGDNDFASASPTTDGKRLYCWFGSAGLYCFDFDGKLVWQRDLGKAFVGSSLGEGCSPVIHDGKLVVVRDHSKQSTISVLDAETGKTLWEKNRDEPNAWATPRVIEYEGKTQVITAASNEIRSYDLANGDVIWRCRGLTGNVIPCPVTQDGVVYCMSGYEGFSLLALEMSKTGDITDTDAVVWKKQQGTPYIPSPLLYGGMLYFSQSNRNILTCLDAATGNEIVSRTRLPELSNIYASPVGAQDRIYLTGRNGKTVVLNRTDKIDVLAVNQLNERIDSSPALAGKQLFLRGEKSLYCISEKQ